MSKRFVLRTLKSKSRYWTWFCPKYWARAGAASTCAATRVTARPRARGPFMALLREAGGPGAACRLKRCTSRARRAGVAPARVSQPVTAFCVRLSRAGRASAPVGDVRDGEGREKELYPERPTE